MKKKIVALGMTSTLLIGFCPLPIYATDIDTTTSKVLYDSEIDVENIGSGDTSSELSTTESSEFVEDSIENIESSTFEETTQEEYVGNQEQASDSSDSNEMIQEIEIPDFDEEQTYPSRRSDLTTSPTTFSTFSSLPAISATDINLPDKNFIDVASWNGEISVEEYKIIKSYGVTGVVVKLTEATSYQNPCAEKQVANALAAGLKVSVYHYSWFTDKNSAREEADYFAKMAIRLNLPKDTVMVNDIEESQIANNNNHTDNSKEFEKRLGELGFTNVNHYVGLNWINVGLIDPVSLGNTKMWVAAYPYTLNTTNRYTEYGAWQWSSRLSFPGVAGEFDISADYAQNYSKNDSENKIDLKKYDKFVTITHRNYPILKSVDGDKKDNSDNHYGKVYEAKQYADYNGIRYISLYNNKGLLVGYINEGATQIANGQNGVYQTYNQYVTIKSKT
ncbi:GH25 family lysozyme, partial [Candidatus Enterococcus willemsii]|uniref:GH25 family lysozyme n=1 Tax=Candidatus Enterococcus willemsii TaxID=1857215 RepID=UPI0023516D11